MNGRPRIRIVERFSDVLPNISAGPLTHALDRDGIVGHWRDLERVARLERDAPAIAAWCDAQLRVSGCSTIEPILLEAEAKAHFG